MSRRKDFRVSKKALATLVWSVISSAYESVTAHPLLDKEKQPLGDEAVSIRSCENMLLRELKNVEIFARTRLLEIVRSMVESAYIIGQQGACNPTIERIRNDRIKGRTALARHAKLHKIQLRDEIIAKYATALWQKNSRRNGNAYGTAMDIKDAFNEELERMGQKAASVRTICRSLHKVPGWTPRETK